MLLLWATFFLLLACGEAGLGPDSSQESSDEVDPAGHDELELALVAEMNRVRTDPQQYIEVVRAYRAEYSADGSSVTPAYMVEEFGVSGLNRRDGFAKVDALISYLGAQSPREPLTPQEDLRKAADLYARYLSAVTPRGASGGLQGPLTHNGDGRYAYDRVREYNQDFTRVHENLARGFFSHQARYARYLILSWLVEDGYDGTGHRDNIMHPELRHVGIRQLDSENDTPPYFRSSQNFAVAVFGD